MEKRIDVTQVQKAIKEAEQIIDVVKDPKIKPIAFDKILDILLSGGGFDLAGKGAIKNKALKKKKTGKSSKTEGPKTWIEELIDEGFFKKSKTSRELLSVLEERGHNLKNSDIQPYFGTFMHEKRLRRKKQAPKEGGKPLWHYSNW